MINDKTTIKYLLLQLIFKAKYNKLTFYFWGQIDILEK